ncbi:MAG: transglutaminase domain-containing protein [Akkermansiaceae bacterium]|nr:transglutaminase domain-containing protein [Akkermansiaceae bacterium]
MNPHPPPPRLLLGTALLCWGALTGHSVVGLVLALIVEAVHWTRLRWDFDELAQIRAWRLSVLLMFLMLVVFWIDDVPQMAVPRLLGWLPALLLPVQFVQAYGLRGSISVRVFSFFSRAQRETKHAYQTDPGRGLFNFGHVYLVAVLLAGTPVWKTPDSWLYLPSLVVLTGWSLIASRRCRWPQVVGLMAVALGLGLAGGWGLDRAFQWFNYGLFRNRGQQNSPSHFRTAIGRLGEIKQSADIVWRLRTEDGARPPTHLRTRGYNRYRSGLWSNLPPLLDDASPTPPRANQGKGSLNEDFNPLEYVERPDGRGFYRLRPVPIEELIRPGMPRFTLRGTVANERPMPLPGTAATLSGFDVESFESNSLGSVIIFPKGSVAEGSVIWQDAGNRDSPPWPQSDLWLDDTERDALREVLAGLHLDQAPTLQAKLLLLQRFFSGFEYSLYNTIEAPRVGAVRGDSAITQFLKKERHGHCEYFATAACLLLREAEIPSRYAIGFVVAEHDGGRGEWVIRGLHAHAWTRVWDEQTGVWIDFDPTPPSWLAAESGSGLSLQWIFDFVLRSNEDFNLWRNKPGNNGLVSGIMLGLGGLGLMFIIHRLWRSKRTVGGPRRTDGRRAESLRTPLHRLERIATKHLPPRTIGVPFARWLEGLKTRLTDHSLLDEALALHQRLRFDPAPSAPADVERLTALTRQLETTLKRQKPNGIVS